jgi:dipeptidyl aminopeptidase/acylaminoacyl peptidase
MIARNDAVLVGCLLLGEGMLMLPGCVAMHFVQPGHAAKGPSPSTAEIVRFPTTDGLTLEGRMFRARCDQPKEHADDQDYPRLPEKFKGCVILHCHGVQDNNCSAMAAFFADAGFRVFQFDYRGFANSDPAPFTNRGFADDALAALHYLRSRPDVDPDRVIVYGHSMGGGYAMAAAAAARQEGKPVRAVITANAFSSWRRVGNDFIPVLGFLLGGTEGPDPIDYARRLGDTPLLIAHVADDEVVPVQNAYRLFDAAIAAKVPASLHVNPDGGHAFPFWGAPTMETAMVDFATHYLDPDRPLSRWEVMRAIDAALKNDKDPLIRPKAPLPAAKDSQAGSTPEALPAPARPSAIPDRLP